MICRKCGRLYHHPVDGVEPGFCSKKCEDTFNALTKRDDVVKPKRTKKKTKIEKYEEEEIPEEE